MGRRWRVWFGADMTAGQRWTASGCALLAILVLVFGIPDTGKQPAAGAPASEHRSLVASLPGTATTTTTTTLPAEPPLPVDADVPPAVITDADVPAVIADAPASPPPPRRTTTGTRSPSTTTTTAPCALPELAGQCVALPLP